MRIENGRTEPLLTVAEVAERLNVSRWTIYEWRTKRVGPPAIVINRAVRFDPDAVAAWIAARAEEPRP